MVSRKEGGRTRDAPVAGIASMHARTHTHKHTGISTKTHTACILSHTHVYTSVHKQTHARADTLIHERKGLIASHKQEKM